MKERWSRVAPWFVFLAACGGEGQGHEGAVNSGAPGPVTDGPDDEGSSGTTTANGPGADAGSTGSTANAEGSGDGGGPADPTACRGKTAPSGDATWTVAVDGGSRTARVHVP